MADEVREAGADGFDLSAKLDATSITTKTCSACHEDKPQDAFSKKAWKARQIRRCIECTTADKPVAPRPPPPPSIEADLSRCAITDDDLGAEGLCPILVADAAVG